MNKEKVERWLKKHGKIINYNALEREANITKGCLQKFVKYGIPLNKEKLIAIERTLQKKFWNNL